MLNNMLSCELIHGGCVHEWRTHVNSNTHTHTHFSNHRVQSKITMKIASITLLLCESKTRSINLRVERSTIKSFASYVQVRRKKELFLCSFFDYILCVFLLRQIYCQELQVVISLIVVHCLKTFFLDSYHKVSQNKFEIFFFHLSFS